MNQTRPRTRAAIAALGLALLVAGCGGDQDVSPRTIRKARMAWEKARIKNYDLEWITTGPQTDPSGAHYAVAVRDGVVQSVGMVRPDGKTAAVHPARPDFYGVDGLFLTLEEEMAQLKTDAPFNAPRGTRVVLKFTPDAKLGYPRSYRRDVLIQPKGLTIDVVRFEPR